MILGLRDGEASAAESGFWRARGLLGEDGAGIDCGKGKGN